MKIKIDFTGQLQRQLGFMENSARAYDAGHRDEAIRLATSLRVLFHQTPKSTSLLRHLGAYANAAPSSRTRESLSCRSNAAQISSSPESQHVMRVVGETRNPDPVRCAITSDSWRQPLRRLSRGFRYRKRQRAAATVCEGELAYVREALHKEAHAKVRSARLPTASPECPRSKLTLSANLFLIPTVAVRPVADRQSRLIVCPKAAVRLSGEVDRTAHVSDNPRFTTRSRVSQPSGVGRLQAVT
jgi:hypothetical protein